MPLMLASGPRIRRGRMAGLHTDQRGRPPYRNRRYWRHARWAEGAWCSVVAAH